MKPVIFAALLLGLCGAGCASPPAAAPPAVAPATMTGHPLITAFADAYNAEDADAMSALLHPEFEWFNLSGAKTETVSSSRDALIADMRSYFAGDLNVTSALSGWTTNGPYVAVNETASWTAADGTLRQQSSLAVYETTPDNLIRRVWYFPVVK